MKWDMVAIKDVAYVTTGKTPPKANNAYFGGDIPFITPAELGEEQYIKTAKQTLTQLATSIIKLVPDNSILVCCIGSLGKLAIANQPVATNQQINAVTFKENVYPKFGYHALAQLRPILNAIAPATTVAIVNKSKFEELRIPLPPMEEQKRIATILDKAYSIRQKRQQNLENADALIKSVFLDMFGDPVTNPKGWEKVFLEDAYEIIDGDRGINYPKQEDFSDAGHCLFLNTGNVTQDGFNFNKVQFISEEKSNSLRKGKLQRGDIVLTTRGTVGNTAYFSEEIPYNTMRINSGMVILRSKNILNPYFFLNLFAFKSVYGKLMSGTAQPQLPIGSLKNAKIINPKQLQNKFAGIVQEIEAQKAKQKKHLHEADQAFKALQQEFFG